MSHSQRQRSSALRRATLGRRLSLGGAGVAIVALAVASALSFGPVLLAALIVALYLGLRLAVRYVLARHDAPLWAPVAATTRAGRIDEDLLDRTLPSLLHPALRTSAAVALAHLRADRHDWDGVRRCTGRMGPLCRGVLGRSLDEAEDGPAVVPGAQVLVWRATLGRLGGMGSDLPGEVLFCVVAILHGRGHYRRALAVGRRAWRADPQSVMAYSCACASARLGENAEALRWLRVALDSGYPALDMADDDDLVSLRHLPEFEALA